MTPVKANVYEVTVEVQRINTNENQWDPLLEFESAYTAADAITQVELRFKHDDRFEKAIVTDVKPRHR